MTESIVLKEYDHNPGDSDLPHREYMITCQDGKVSTAKKSHNRQATTRLSARNILAVLKQICLDLFLPLGYPQSVRPEYMSYQIYDSLQGLCSYLRGVVSTSALLTAAGVGTSEASAMSAAITWAMRDGLGMIGGLLFSYSTSSLFDANVKEFRLFADVINDVGLTLDMIAPYVDKEHVLYVTGLGTICKVMCGIAAGATKGSITQHFCLRGNMADLNAKEGTQETLVSLVGMLMGIALARYLHYLEQRDVSLTATVSWTIFTFLTLVHVWANYEGVKVLRLRTLNRERASVALRGIVEQLATKSPKACTNNESISSLVDFIPTPEQTNESLWASTQTLLFSPKIRLGVQAKRILENLESQDMITSLMKEFADEKYILGISRGGGICVALCANATDQDELKAFIHAMTIQQCVEEESFKLDNDHSELISRTHREVSEVFSTSRGINVLDGLADRGWDVKNRLYLGYGKWRLQWSSTKTE